MARARCEITVQNAAGDRIVGASVYVYQPGTTTPISETIFSGFTGGSTYPNPLTSDGNGQAFFYLDVPKRVDIRAFLDGVIDRTISNVQVEPDASDSNGALLTAKGALVAASAANTPSTLAPGTDGYVLTADSTATNGVKWAASPGTNAVTVLDRDVTVATLNTSSAETTLYTYTVPGGTLSTNKRLRIRATADHKNNSGGAADLTLRLKYGGTLFALSAPNLADTANRYGIIIDATVTAQNATNAQRTGTMISIGAAGSAASPPSSGSSNNFSPTVNNGLAIDSTADQALIITAQHSTNSANQETRLFDVVVELL